MTQVFFFPWNLSPQNVGNLETKLRHVNICVWRVFLNYPPALQHSILIFIPFAFCPFSKHLASLSYSVTCSGKTIPAFKETRCAYMQLEAWWRQYVCKYMCVPNTTQGPCACRSQSCLWVALSACLHSKWTRVILLAQQNIGRFHRSYPENDRILLFTQFSHIRTDDPFVFSD